ncbi:hypothetical protein M9H77_04709 [Catharanthus roseus]|uniref:Uncharacterized protein n=1 Tax=Catharanthus roseus TaxID=4058 RepID=A0ACC0CEW1_CATRO|nr:hypothetical protein M9H77_04709 [Catharanthus roseus]
MDELKKARQMVEEPVSNCLHYLRKSHGLPCACELVNWCQHLMPIQEEDVVIFWRLLEIGSDIPEEHHRDMESELRDLNSLLQKISTGQISNVREVRRLIKGVIHPVLPDDHCQPLSTPRETAVRKEQRKTNCTKRDKSHYGSGSNPSPRGRDRPPRSGKSRGRGRSNGRSSLSTVVSPNSPPVPFPFKNAFLGDENHWVEKRRRMSYDLRHRMHVYEQLFSSVERVTGLIMQTNWEEGSAPPEYWMNTSDHLYVIANTFNICVTDILLSLVNGCPLPPLHVQWEYHQDMRVNGWAAPYRNWMADWVTRYSEMYPPQRHFM